MAASRYTAVSICKLCPGWESKLTASVHRLVIFFRFAHKNKLNRASIPTRKRPALPPVHIRFAHVPRVGVEPTSPFEDDILSVARIPIPPPGHSEAVSF